MLEPATEVRLFGLAFGMKEAADRDNTVTLEAGAVFPLPADPRERSFPIKNISFENIGLTDLFARSHWTVADGLLPLFATEGSHPLIGGTGHVRWGPTGERRIAGKRRCNEVHEHTRSPRQQSVCCIHKVDRHGRPHKTPGCQPALGPVMAAPRKK